MRTLKIVSVILGAAAAPPTRAEQVEEFEPDAQTWQWVPGRREPWAAREENARAGATGREAEIPLAAAYPTQAARAALLDASLARAASTATSPPPRPSRSERVARQTP